MLWPSFRYGDDQLYLKVLVAMILVFDTAHQALITHTAYTYLVTHFSQPPALLNMVK